MLRRRVRPHHVRTYRRHLTTGSPHHLADGTHAVLALGVLKDAVHVDGPLVPQRADRLGKEVHRGVREIEDDPVQRGPVPQDVAGICLADLNEVRAVRGDILTKEAHRDRVDVRSDHAPRSTTFRDEDRVRSDSGERVGHDFPFRDLVRNPKAFAPQARAEVRSSDVHVVSQPELRVDGRRPSLTREEIEVPHAERPHDASVLSNDPESWVPLQNGAGDGLAVPRQGLRDFEDGDVSDDVEGTGKRPAESFGHVGDIPVAANRRETLLALPLLSRPPDVDAFRRRQVEPSRHFADPQVPLKDVALPEDASGFLPTRPRHDDAPGPHAAVHATDRMKRFRGLGGQPSWIPLRFRRKMGELVFIGLGLHDEKGITLRGLEEARRADIVFAEFYTSALLGARIEAVEALVGKPIRRLGREQVEKGEDVLEAARANRVAFLVAGDPMVATTHVDLRLRATAAGIPTRVVHGVSILGAAAGALGLQAYKFGRTTTVPFASPGFRPASPLDPILENRKAGLHSLVLLDLREDGTFLDPKEALRSLLAMAGDRGTADFGPSTLVCVLSQVGSADPRIATGRVADLLKRDLGPPLHCLVVPGTLHFLERDALVAFAGAKAYF